MYSKHGRPRRTNLASFGYIYLGEEEHKITIKNISIAGVLVQLNSDRDDIDIKYIFNQLLVSTILDLYLPEMRLAGEAEVVRADMEGGHILLALEYKNIAFDIDQHLNRRKAYRKYMTDFGKIFFNDEWYFFTTVNVSVKGLMIYISQEISVEVGTITQFEFKQLELEGEIKVIWVDHISNSPDRTFIGLQYMHLEKSSINGIPTFNPQQTS